MKTSSRFLPMGPTVFFSLFLALAGGLLSAAPLKTTLLPSKESPLVAFRILFHAGSIDDPAGKEGLSALTAAVIGQGGTRKLTYQRVIETLYPMAADISVQSDKEVTVLIGNVHRDHLEPFYEILSRLILEPRFDPEDFKRNRELQLNYLRNTLRGNDDETLGKEALNTLMYRNHPYGFPVEGTVQGVEAITLEDVRAFYRKHYTRAAVHIGMAGGYPAAFVGRIQSDLGRLPVGRLARKPLPAARTGEGTDVLLVKKQAPATAVSMGFPIAITRSHPDFYALMVANSYLGEHRTFNGVLMNRMRGLRGLNYGDYSYIENFIQEGGSTFPVPNVPRRQQFFSIWIRPVAPANTHFATRQAIRELRNLADKGMSEEDFESTRKFVINYSKLWAQTLSRRLGYQMDSEFYKTGYFIDRIQKELSALTLERVNAAIRQYLASGSLKIAIIVEDAEGLKKALSDNTVSPIVYQSGDTPAAILEEDKIIEKFPLNVNAKSILIVPVAEMFERRQLLK